MKKIAILFTLIGIMSCILITDCKKKADLPKLTTNPVTDITLNSARSGGSISDDGGADITIKGICWGSQSNPSTKDSFVESGAGIEDFSSDLTDLVEGTVYYVRAYATNSEGTAYGNEETFTTLASTVATVTTKAVTEVTFTTAKSGGDITGDGGAAITEKGICWNTSENPTTDNNRTSDGSGNDGFISSLSGLTEGTTYYVRAYAVNSKGTAYGNQQTFTTAVTTAPSLTTKAVTEITFTTAKSGGDISSDGGAAVTAKGICWNTSVNPTVTNTHTTDGTGTDAFTSNLTGLTEGTVYYVRAYATNSKGTTYGNQQTFTTTGTNIPAVTTKAVTEIAFTTAKSGGDISSDGGAPVTAKGICWNIAENPTIDNSHTTDGTGTDTFTSDLTGLTESTTYYVRAYATNSKGTAYGNQLTFTTTGTNIPVVTTKAVTEIALTTAKSGGDISSDGGLAVTAKGICWNTAENPTITNTHTTDGTGTDTFVSSLTGLTEGTTYYVRAYATNSKGTAYGNQVTFLTTSSGLPVLTTKAVTGITTSAAKSGGDIARDGGDAVTIRGICWNTAENPTTANNRTIDGTGTGSYESSMEGLGEGVTYYVRAYATNSRGTAYGNQVSFTTVKTGVATITTKAVTEITVATAKSGGDIANDGGSAIVTKGICWNIAENPTILNNHTSDGSGTDAFVSSMAGLAEGTTYYVRAYATNGKGTGYGNQVSFTTNSVVIPVISTKNVTEVTFTTAKSGGDISSDGGAEISTKGICWNTTENPTVENSHVNAGTGTETFTGNITGLTENTTYYVRAYATNRKGTGYGTQQFFTTLAAALPVVTTKAASEISATSVKSGGDITSESGAPITAKGVCWSTSQNPTIDNDHTSDGTGSTTFVSTLSGLKELTVYYARAYATNKVGTSYGPQITFTTTALKAPELTTAAITGITPTAAVSGGNITSDGGSTVTARGVCWNTSQNPTVDNNKTTNGTGPGVFVSNITGLSSGTVYYVRAYATNSTGTSYGNELSFATPVADIEGNLYKTVVIGNQVWMAENLKTTKYNDNTAITYITEPAAWAAADTLLTAGFCWYQNSLAAKDTYGGLYNWFTVATGKLCPTGWHVPAQAEFIAMEQFIGVPADSLTFWGWRGLGIGTHLKNITGWTGGNGDNVSGFTALPAGYRTWVNGGFVGQGIITYFWTATDDSMNHKPTTAWYRMMLNTDTRIFNAATEKGSGKSIRCVKDH